MSISIIRVDENVPMYDQSGRECPYILSGWTKTSLSIIRVDANVPRHDLGGRESP